MEVIVTKHFLLRWKERVGDYRPSVRRRIFESIDYGNVRKHPEDDRGIIIGLRHKKKPIYIVAVPDNEKLCLITVLQSNQVQTLGWEPMKMRIPDRLKQHICGSCGDYCIPMTGGDKWYNSDTGVYESVVVCPNCFKRFGEWAKKMASKNLDTYYREVVGWGSSGTTKGSAAPSN